MNKEQLKLSPSELVSIGFEKSLSESDEMNTAKTFFKIPTLNGYFYYNPDETVHVWYYKTIIGDVSNHAHLDIRNGPELFVTLSSFRVEFNLVLI